MDAMGRHAAQTSAVSTLTIPTMTRSDSGTFFDQHSASSFSVAASQQQQQLALRTNRPVWKRLTRTISHAFLATKSKKKTKKRDVSDPSPATLDLVSNKEKQRQREHINMSTHSLVKLVESTTTTQEVQADLYKQDEEICSSRFGDSETTPAPVTRGDASNVCERQSGATHIVALVTMIPPEYPLVRYIAESLFAEVDLPCQAAPDDGNSIEWRLFVKCIELQKWSLAFVLAEKMQRNHTMQPQQRRRKALMQDRAVSVDGDDNEAENDDADERDGILDFLDTCSA